MRSLTRHLSLLGLALLLAAASPRLCPAQCARGGGGGGRPPAFSTLTRGGGPSPLMTALVQRQIQQQLLLQQQQRLLAQPGQPAGPQQRFLLAQPGQQPMFLQQRQQALLGLRDLLAKEDNAVLARALRHPNALIREAATLVRAERRAEKRREARRERELRAEKK